MSFEAEFDDMGFEPEGEDEIEVLCREALLQLEHEDIDAARSTAMEAVSMDEEHPFPVFVLGLIAEYEGDLPAARYLGDRALHRAPTNSDAIQFRANIHAREGELDQAERLLRYGIVHNPDDATLHEGVARVCIARGDLTEAIASAQSALRIDPSNPGAHAVRAAALDASGDTDAMLAVMRQTVQMNPDDPYSMVELATLEAEHGEMPRARVLLARAHRIAPRDHHIGDARRILEGASDHPILKPLPTMQRWLATFPGGLPGFLVAFLIAALPMHVLATGYPNYLLPVWILLGCWAGAAMYLWIAPAIMSVRLNRAAADTAQERLTRDDADLDGLIDAVALLFAGKRYRSGLALLRQASLHVHGDAQLEFEHLHSTLGARRYRWFYRLASIPGDTRILPALAVLLLVGAPVFAAASALPLALWQIIPAVLIAVAWTIALVDSRVQHTLSSAFRTVNALAEPITRQAPNRDKARRVS